MLPHTPNYHNTTCAADIRNFGGEVTLNVRKKKLIPLYEVNFAVGWEGQELNPEDGSVTFSAEGQIEVWVMGWTVIVQPVWVTVCVLDDESGY